MAEDDDTMSAKKLIHSFETGKVMNKQQKHVLIVYAHQEPSSFNGALLSQAVETLTTEGHSVEVSDLYSMHFEPRAQRSDVTGKNTNPEFFKYQMETKVAYQEGTLADDIRSEMQKVQRADLVIFQFPMYWFSFPSILKGWFDRVFVMGFAYGMDKLYQMGPMQGKRAMLSFTTGGPKEAFSASGMNGDMNVILWPMQRGVLSFVGFDVLYPSIHFSAAHVGQEDREGWLTQWSKRLTRVFEETPIEFLHISNFTNMQVDQEYVESQEGKQYGPSVGFHLGKPFKPNSMIQP